MLDCWGLFYNGGASYQRNRGFSTLGNPSSPSLQEISEGFRVRVEDVLSLVLPESGARGSMMAG